MAVYRDSGIIDMRNKTRIVEINMDELSLIILESMFRKTRPKGKSTLECLDMLTEELREDALRSADAASEYIIKCIQESQIPS